MAEVLLKKKSTLIYYILGCEIEFRAVWRENIEGILVDQIKTKRDKVNILIIRLNL